MRIKIDFLKRLQVLNISLKIIFIQNTICNLDYAFAEITKGALIRQQIKLKLQEINYTGRNKEIKLLQNKVRGCEDSIIALLCLKTRLSRLISLKEL